MAEIVAFTTPGPFTWEVPEGVSQVEVLVVAGGGGGGAYRGGGGGAGGLLHTSDLAITPGALLSGHVGLGGAGWRASRGANGEDSAFGSLTAIGGGGGGLGSNRAGDGRSGGSGGGASGELFDADPGSGTAGQGYDGGANNISSAASERAGGGGGGAGGAGGDAGNSFGGNGGEGVDLSSAFGVGYGAAGWFASGGGGSTDDPESPQGIALQGGGGSANASGDAEHGIANTGGGGGGAGGGLNGPNVAGTGGSGIVLIRYDAPPPATFFNVTQNVRRQNGAAPILILSQRVSDATRYDAVTLVDFYQRAVRSEPTAPILTLLQQVGQRHVAGILIELSQSVSQLTQQSAALIRLSQSVVHAPIDDWEASAPTERQTIYVLDVGSVRVPISSAQATMRLSGQSFLQAVIPNAGAYATELAAMVGETMLLRSGYLYADGALSSLEIIAAAPFQLSSQATGPVNDTLTISGYGHRTTTTSATRALRGIQASTIGQDGKRRVRCALDLFLRPGHTALDNDGTALTVNIIQYFINATSDGMEVIS